MGTGAGPIFAAGVETQLLTATIVLGAEIATLLPLFTEHDNVVDGGVQATSYDRGGPGIGLFGAVNHSALRESTLKKIQKKFLFFLVQYLRERINRLFD